MLCASERQAALETSAVNVSALIRTSPLYLDNRAPPRVAMGTREPGVDTDLDVLGEPLLDLGTLVCERFGAELGGRACAE